MRGFRFSKYIPPPKGNKSNFEQLLNIFMQLLVITSGDMEETLDWMVKEKDIFLEQHSRLTARMLVKQ